LPPVRRSERQQIPVHAPRPERIEPTEPRVQRRPRPPVNLAPGAERLQNREIPVIPRPTLPNPESPHSQTSEEERRYLLTDPVQFFFPPETVYIAPVLPTRSPKALTSFKAHCRLQYNNFREGAFEVVLPVNLAYQFTPDPLVFQNCLWKTRTLITFFGIFEEYHWIRRHHRNPNQIFLARAYKITYPWDSDGWNVTRLIRA
jgi:hypothetical protein